MLFGVKHKGFTLIELLIGVSIVAILITVGIPSFISVMQQNRVDNLSMMLVKDLRTTRSQSISLRQPVTACFVNNADTCVQNNGVRMLIFVDDNGNGVFNNTEHLIKQGEDLSSSIIVTNSETRYVFRSDGLLNGNSGTITLCSNRSDITGQQISVLASGLVQSQDKNDC
ncbi:GspH/FimT family pseudopilin [Dongshaea marina]|uniref:GspH/FimT family pseudopilin n=1 Tax=Dongshaea marina TaxID=2047966 RepID=UPI00131F2F94|nr:GspH/FimT family pseudopilin [Dongshaea marina]